MTREQEIAQKIGITPEVRRVDFSVLLKEGVVVDLKISRFRGQTKLTKEDLGLADMGDEEYARFEDEYIHLGQKTILPADVRKRAAQIETAARENLRGRSFETEWGRFVACGAFPKWKERNDGLKGDYSALLAEVLEDYEGVKEAVHAEYLKAGRVAYRRLSAAGAAWGSEEEFAQSFADRVAELFPSPEKLQQTWIYDESVFFYPVPREIKEDLEEIARHAEQDIVDVSKKTALETMGRELARKSMGKKEEIVEQFFSGVASQLRNMALEAVKGVAETVSKHGKLQKRSGKKLQEAVEKLKAMNFYDDEALNAEIGNIEKVLAVAESNQESGTIEEMLTDIQKSLQGMLLDLGPEGRTGHGGELVQVVMPDVGQAGRRGREESAEVAVKVEEPARRRRAAS